MQRLKPIAPRNANESARHSRCRKFRTNVVLPVNYGALAISAFLFSTRAYAAVSEQEVVHRLYQRSLAGDKYAVDECIAKLEDRLKAEPGNQLARVYLGSAYTLRSRDLGFSPAKLTTLRHGLALMDEAVAATPNDAHVRLLRALTTQALPSFFGRRKSARDDFEALVAMLSKDPDKLSATDQQTIYYNAGVAAQQSGNAARARELWKDAAKHPIDPALAEKVNAALVGK
jgi:tetratricopeptide (TPR) repeat protein